MEFDFLISLNWLAFWENHILFGAKCKQNENDESRAGCSVVVPATVLCDFDVASERKPKWEGEER